jgi:AraC-like DNA-binding protein
VLDSLSIRAYTPVVCSHEHDFHQIVLPLHGFIEVEINGIDGIVGVGQVVIIQRGVQHSFHAHEESRFLVADVSDLPANAGSLTSPFASTSNAMQSYCDFVDTQLQDRTNVDLEEGMLSLFRHLLLDQEFSPKISNRISRVLAYIRGNLDEECTLEQLASIANLSISHFKVEFKKQTGSSPGEYLIAQRMEKARALLNNTDFPVQIIADCVGYRCPSAFSRRFSAYFGEPPSKYRHR